MTDETIADMIKAFDIHKIMPEHEEALAMRQRLQLPHFMSLEISSHRPYTVAEAKRAIGLTPSPSE